MIRMLASLNQLRRGSECNLSCSFILTKHKSHPLVDLFGSDIVPSTFIFTSLTYFSCVSAYNFFHYCVFYCLLFKHTLHLIGGNWTRVLLLLRLSLSGFPTRSQSFSLIVLIGAVSPGLFVPFNLSSLPSNKKLFQLYFIFTPQKPVHDRCCYRCINM